jgi:hypothetical protein
VKSKGKSRKAKVKNGKKTSDLLPFDFCLMTYEYCPIDKKAENLKLGRGYDATRQFLKENKKIADEILKEIRKSLKEGDVLSSGETAEKSEE